MIFRMQKAISARMVASMLPKPDGGTGRAQERIRARQGRPHLLEEFRQELKHYVGRPSPIYHAKRWSEQLGGAQIFFKREDLNHTGAHKISNAIGRPRWHAAWASCA
jgi:hypothetical protein